MSIRTKRNLSSKFLAVSLITAMSTLAAITVSAQFLTNVNFEIEPLGLDSAADTFPGWTEGAGAAAVNAPTPITGNHSAKLNLVTAGRLYQPLVDTNNALTQWIFDVDFACNNAGATRSFQVILQTTTSFSTFRNINLRVVDNDGDGTGDVQLYNGAAFVTVLPNAVTYSESETTLSINHLTVVGHYSDATPNYDVFVVDASNVTNSVLAQTHYQGAPPTPGSPLRQLSFETGSFAGSAFAVVDNVAVTNFGSVSSAPVITSQPVSQSILEGASTVTFNSTFSGTPPLFVQWLFNSNSIAEATNATLSSSTLTLTNIALADAGNYSLFVSNSLGTAVSSNGVLTVRPVSNTAQMTNLWNLLPGERAYLAASGNTERGLAFNPATSNLLVASRAGGADTIAVLDAQTGAEKHLLDISVVVGGVPNQSISMSMMGVAEDGAVFVGSATVSASLPPYYLYRWADDSASASGVPAFIGDPAKDVEPNLRWGDNLAVRGSGPNTQILLAPGGGTNVVMLRTTSGLDFQTEILPAVIAISGVSSGFAQHSITFGPGTNTFWSKNWGGSLRLIEFDLNSNTGRVLHSYNDSVVPHLQSEVIALAADNNRNFLAAVAVETPDNVRLYDVADLTTGPVLRDQELFTVDNANTTINGTGSAAFGGDYLFVLDSNNGIKAFLINTNFVTQLPPFNITGVTPSAGLAVVLTWESMAGRQYQIQYKDSLSDLNWLDASGTITATGSTLSFTNAVTGVTNRFYRVQGQ